MFIVYCSLTGFASQFQGSYNPHDVYSREWGCGDAFITPHVFDVGSRQTTVKRIKIDEELRKLKILECPLEKIVFKSLDELMNYYMDLSDAKYHIDSLIHAVKFRINERSGILYFLECIKCTVSPSETDVLSFQLTKLELAKRRVNDLINQFTKKLDRYKEKVRQFECSQIYNPFTFIFRSPIFMPFCQDQAIDKSTNSGSVSLGRSLDNPIIYRTIKA